MSTTEGLFCDEEGFCVCGNDCLKPLTYPEAWRFAEAERDFFARRAVELVLQGHDAVKVALNSQRFDCELYMIHRAWFGPVASTTEAEWAFIVGRSYAFGPSAGVRAHG